MTVANDYARDLARYLDGAWDSSEHAKPSIINDRTSRVQRNCVRIQRISKDDDPVTPGKIRRTETFWILVSHPDEDAGGYVVELLNAYPSAGVPAIIEDFSTYDDDDVLRSLENPRGHTYNAWVTTYSTFIKATVAGVSCGRYYKNAAGATNVTLSLAKAIVGETGQLVKFAVRPVTVTSANASIAFGSLFCTFTTANKILVGGSDTGVTWVSGTWYEFEFTYTAATTATFTINGVATALGAQTIATISSFIFGGQSSAGTGDVYFAGIEAGKLPRFQHPRPVITHDKLAWINGHHEHQIVLETTQMVNRT